MEYLLSHNGDLRHLESIRLIGTLPWINIRVRWGLV
jgi:hypothetical protein